MSGLPPTPRCLVPGDDELQSAVTGVVTADEGFSPAVHGIFPSYFPTGVESGIVGLSSLLAAHGLKTPDLRVLTDLNLRDGIGDSAHTDLLPTALGSADTQSREAPECHTPNVYDGYTVVPTSASVLAPGSRPFCVGRPTRSIDICTFQFSSNRFAQIYVDGNRKVEGRELDWCAGAVWGMPLSGVCKRWGTTSRAEGRMEIVHMDLAGPTEPSMCGSAYLIMFVNRVSWWMRPYRMARISNTSQ